MAAASAACVLSLVYFQQSFTKSYYIIGFVKRHRTSENYSSDTVPQPCGRGLTSSEESPVQQRLSL